MILKLIRGDYFRGAISYITRTGEYAGKDEARILRLEDLLNLKTATAQLVQQASLAPTRTKRVVHILGRAEKGLTDAQYNETIDRCLRTLGLQGRPYVSVIHDDDGHFHVVTVEQDEHGKAPPRRLYSRMLKQDVTAAESAKLPKGDVVSRSWDSHACWRLSKIARQVEVDFGLRQLRTGVTTGDLEEALERIKIPGWQLQRENEQGLIPLALQFGTEIKAALNLPDWDERAEALEVYGLAMRSYEGANKRREGIQIYAQADPSHCCNGSDLGKNYGLGALNKRGAMSFGDWLSERVETTVSAPPYKATKATSAKTSPERDRLRSKYDAYALDHRRRRTDRTKMNAQHQKRRKDIRGTVKAARPALLATGLRKNDVRRMCRVMREALDRRSDAEYLEKFAALAPYPPRKSTWSEWLVERASEDPAAMRVYDDMRRRLSAEERDADLKRAAKAKAEREAEATRVSAEATKRAEEARASEAKLARIAAEAKARHAAEVKRASDEAAKRAEEAKASEARLARIMAEANAREDAARARADAEHRSKRRAAAVAMLDRAERERWMILGSPGRYTFLSPDLKLCPGGEQLMVDPEERAFLMREMGRLHGLQQTELARILDALRATTHIGLDKNGWVEEQSVPVDLRPMLKPRRWWSEVCQAAKDRKNSLEQAAAAALAAKAATPVAPPPPEIPVSPVVVTEKAIPTPPAAQQLSPKGNEREPAVLENGLIERASTQRGLSKSAEAAPPTGPAAAKVTSPPAAESETEIKDRKAQVPLGSQILPPLDSAEPPKPAPQDAGASQTTASRQEWESMIADIDEWDYTIAFNPVTQRYEIPHLVPEMQAVLFSPAHDRSTQERLATLARAREVDQAIAMVITAPPNAIRFEGKTVSFPGFAASERDILERQMAHEKVAAELDKWRQAREAEYEDLLAQYGASRIDRDG